MNEATQEGMPPHIAILETASGGWRAQALYVAAKLGIADLVQDEPKTAEELASATGTHANSLFRVLRALASMGIFTEQDGRFALTPLAEPLRSNVPGSMRAMAIMLGEEHQRAWGNILHSVRTGETAFDHVYGMHCFEYLEQNPESGATFNDAMTALSSQTHVAVVSNYDFSGIETLVDVGGGHGTLLSLILKANPQLRGKLFDLPHVVNGAPRVLEAHGVTDRCEVSSGDFFKEVPAGDAYILSHIIHDWVDERSIQILSSCRRAAQGNARLLLVEMVIPEGNDPFWGKWLDLNMLMMTPGGRERTEQQYRDLLSAAGWEMQRIVPTQGLVSVVESYAK